MEQTLTLEGEQYAFVKSRRLGGAVFVNRDHSRYARVGLAVETEREAALTETLFERGFPVPRVLSRGTVDEERSYYTETSIGTVVFGEQFEQEWKKEGTVSPQSFSSFLSVLTRYAEAQSKKQNQVEGSQKHIDNCVSLENVLRNNPPQPESEERFFEAYKKASTQVLRLPFVYAQADLNAFNMLEDGVIDFEHACHAPLGFDISTCLLFPTLWPERATRYRFSDTQTEAGMHAIQNILTSVGVPHAHAHTMREEFLLLKLIRATAKAKESELHAACNPEFWRWRTRVRDSAVHSYLNNEPIDPSTFEEIGGSINTYPEHVGH